MREPGFTSSAKLVTFRGSVIVLVIEPLCPFNVTLYGSGIALFGTVIVSVDVDEPPLDTVGLFGLSWTPKPLPETVAERETGPEKPLRLVKVMIELVDPPWIAVKDEGFAAMLKSGASFTMSSRVAEWEREPLVEVTVVV